jgi:hypothetical protein
MKRPVCAYATEPITEQGEEGMFSARRLLVAFVTTGAFLSAALAQAARQPESLNVRAFAVSFAASSIDVDDPPDEYHGDWPRPSPE